MTDLSLEELRERRPWREALEAAGLSPEASEAKVERFQAAAGALAALAPECQEPVRAFFVPGRIEVLGKHTDYAGGRSLVAAADVGICLLTVARDDARIRVAAADRGETAECRIDPDLQPTDGWANYPMTVARRVARNFPGPLRGADIAFCGDLPPAAGMSSSSALLIAAFCALSGANSLPDRPEYHREIRSPEDLAGYLATVENGQSFGSLTGDRGVGTFGGSEDHTAILCCRAGQVSLYSYCPVRLERRVTLPEEWTFAIASSGVLAEKTGEARERYNRASRLAAEAAARWRDRTGGSAEHLAGALTEAGGPDPVRAALGAPGDEDLLRRFEHFLTESEQVIPAAVDALADGDFDEFGRQTDVSQAQAEKLLGNQVPQTARLAAAARRELGAAAASAFGAGFGGSVWALVRREEATTFLARWARGYAQAFPDCAPASRFFLARPGPAAAEILGESPSQFSGVAYHE